MGTVRRICRMKADSFYGVIFSHLHLGGGGVAEK